MANTVKLVYTRKFTNKLSDGSFESFELGGESELDLGEVDSIDDVNASFNQLYSQFVANVEEKVLEVQGSLTTSVAKPAPAPTQPESRDARLASWVKKTVDENTEKIRPAATLPGERFKTPPKEQVESHTQSEDIVEGEAVAYENVRVFLENKATKIGKTTRGTKFGMLRIGDKNQLPGDGYATAKSFEAEIVDDIEAVIDQGIKFVDVFGVWEPRNNDPEVFDLVLQGIRPSQG